MKMCTLCGEHVRDDDAAHGEARTPAHLKAWANLWSWQLKDKNPKKRAQAANAIAGLRAELQRLDQQPVQPSR